jgi:8-oxo-dGTP pyrophosphatase MutT (NUDIX family)|tara:strand:+ start:3675 stop:4118 length:444 start_codon:yes stop_codon:yes gene_type:complete
MGWNPHITVATLVRQQNRFLLVEEWEEDALVLNQPAGHLDENESLEQGAVRETLEETGWRVQLRHISGIYLHTSPRTGITYLRTCYLADPIEQTEQPLDEGIERIIWMTRDEVKQQSSRWRSPLVLKCIDDHLKERAYPLSLIQHVP